MKNLITEDFKEKFKLAFTRFMNITIVASTLIAGFGLGYYFQELKVKPQAVNETILNKEVRIAVDSEDKLVPKVEIDFYLKPIWVGTYIYE